MYYLYLTHRVMEAFGTFFNKYLAVYKPEGPHPIIQVDKYDCFIEHKP